MMSRTFTSPQLENRVVAQTNKGSSQESGFGRILEVALHWITLDISEAQSPFSMLDRWSSWTEIGLMSAEDVTLLSLYPKVWFSFRVLANLAGKTHKSAPNLVQIEQIPRYHPHILKTSPSFIFEAIVVSLYR